MIRNYFKIVFRNLKKHKLFSLINIISLGIGISASFVIGLMVFYDFTFDKFHPDGERIYRVVTKIEYATRTQFFSGVPVPLATAVSKKISGVETTSYFFSFFAKKISVQQGDRVFKRPEAAIFVDGEYFNLLDYTWLAGNKEKALKAPNQVILTEERAKRYFPNFSPQQVLGEILVYNDSINAKVTGIVANFDQRTDFVFQEFVSMPTALQTDQKKMISGTNWHNLHSSTELFIKLSKNTDSRSVQKQLNEIAKTHASNQNSFILQPLAQLHFSTKYGGFVWGNPPADKSVLLALSGIALFLLLLGCINFINLNTAQATKRAKEIGIRKTLGSSKKQLVFQFLGETFLQVVFAGLISLLLTILLLRVFSDFIPSGLNIRLLANPMLIGCALLLFIVVTFLAGFYPAVVLSSFKPVSAIKNEVASGSHTSSLRKYLTVFQFVIAQFFVIATLFVGKQIRFMLDDNMGFRTEAVAYFRCSTQNGATALFEEMKQLPEVKSIAVGGSFPASKVFSSMTFDYYYDNNVISTLLRVKRGDTNYLNLYDINLLAGRNLRENDSKEFIINETYMTQLGFKNPSDVLGELLEYENNYYPIVGVMQDFHQKSFKYSIDPVAFTGNWWKSPVSSRIHFLIKKGAMENLSTLIGKVKNAYQEVYPGKEFNLQFVDESIQRFYEQEQRTVKLLNWATGLSILISCLGLLGLVIYTTERRTKEIGVRKVLGASLPQLNFLLCKEFLVLVFIAFLVALPIAYWWLDRWIQDYVFKTELSWRYFLFIGIGMLLLALLIMVAITSATARKNPVESLRTE